MSVDEIVFGKRHSTPENSKRGHFYSTTTPTNQPTQQPTTNNTNQQHQPTTPTNNTKQQHQTTTPNTKHQTTTPNNNNTQLANVGLANVGLAKIAMTSGFRVQVFRCSGISRIGVSAQQGPNVAKRPPGTGVGGLGEVAYGTGESGINHRWFSEGGVLGWCRQWRGVSPPLMFEAGNGPVLESADHRTLLICEAVDGRSWGRLFSQGRSDRLLGAPWSRRPAG